MPRWGRIQAGLVRRRFAIPAGLVAGLYAALVQYLEAKELLRFVPFDAAIARVPPLTTSMSRLSLIHI